MKSGEKRIFETRHKRHVPTKQWWVKWPWVDPCSSVLGLGVDGGVDPVHRAADAPARWPWEHRPPSLGPIWWPQWRVSTAFCRVGACVIHARLQCSHLQRGQVNRPLPFLLRGLDTSRTVNVNVEKSDRVPRIKAWSQKCAGQMTYRFLPSISSPIKWANHTCFVELSLIGTF